MQYLVGCWLCSRVVDWQLRFSLCSGAVTTNVLTMVASLYYLLITGSVEYPMLYASCLECCGVLLCCISLSCSSACSLVFSLKELCLSEVLGFCSLFYLVHSCNALWDSMSRHIPSGIACLVSQAPDWQLHSGMACLACGWLIYDWCPPKCVYCKTSCNWLPL